MKGLSLLWIAICISTLVACQPSDRMIPVTDKSQIIGKWRESDTILEIFEDGTTSYTNKEIKEPISGRYELPKDGIVRASRDGSKTKDYRAYIFKEKLIDQVIECENGRWRLRQVEKFIHCFAAALFLDRRFQNQVRI